MVKAPRKNLRTKSSSEPIKVRGFFRLNIVEAGEDGKPRVVGDTGWRENLITNEGFRSFLARSLGAIASSSQVSYAALGTGGAPIATDSTLAGELTDASNCRMLVTAATSSSSKAVTFTFTLNSGIVTTARSISNVGLFSQSNTNTATLFAGTTYSSSSLATNQAVNGTYSISFS